MTQGSFHSPRAAGGEVSAPGLGELYRDFKCAESRFFDELTRKTYRMAGSVLRRKGITQHDRQQDIALEVLTSVVADCRTNAAFLQEIRDWDRVLVRRLCWRMADFVRARQRIERFEDIPLDTLHEALPQLTAPGADQNSARAELAEFLEAFQRAEGIDEDTLTIFHARLAGASFEEISKETGLSVNACTLRVRRFQERLGAWAQQMRAAGSL